MDRRRFVLASGASVACALAGCVGSAMESNGSADRGNGDRGTVTVVGRGVAEADPDVATVTVGVEARAEDAATVRTSLAERADALRTALVEFGIDEDHITTDRFYIRERRDRTPDRPTPDGGGETEGDRVFFEGIHAYRVEVDDVEDVGNAIDVAVDAGADDVGRVRFTLADETRDALRDEALEVALENARAEAETIANGMEFDLVGVKSVTTADVGVRPSVADAPMAETYDAANAPPTEIDAGPVTVTATVEVTYTTG